MLSLKAILVVAVVALAGAVDVPLGGNYWKGSAPAPGQLWGFTDTHTHPLNHHGFGGKLFFGNFSGPIDEALSSCAHAHGHVGQKSFTIGPEPGEHAVDGFPDFTGWPVRSSMEHQQMYQDWLKHAWQGGLRVIHADLGNSKFLALEFEKINKFIVGENPYPSSDKDIIPGELEALDDFLALNGDWAGVARNSTELHTLVSDGKLAIVLGAELDSPDEILGVKNFTGPAEDARPIIAKNLKKIYDLGIRHLFGIHLVNSRFGGCAIYSGKFDLNNYYTLDSFFKIRNGWEDGIRYNIDADTSATDFILRIATDLPKPHYPQFTPPSSTANGQGLSELGIVFFQEVMKLGMIVDISHMSTLSKNDTLTMAEQINYPVLASHGRPRAVQFGYEAASMFDGSSESHKVYNTSNPSRIAGERAISDDEMRRVAALGGLLGSTISSHAVTGTDCDGSAKAWARTYDYATSIMGQGAVGFGTDTNGFAGVSGPRFGPLACKTASDGDKYRENIPAKQAALQSRGVTYDSNITDAGSWRFRFAGKGYAYTERQRDVWQGVARFIAGEKASPKSLEESKHSSTVFERSVENGFKLASLSAPMPDADDDAAAAAWLAYRCVTCNTTFGGSDGSDIRLVWKQWLEFVVPNDTALYNNPPLKRMTLGNSERDINIDGQVTLGQIPDLLQDAHNNGADVSGIFRTAERYYQLMRKGEQVSQVAVETFPSSMSRLPSASPIE